MTSEPIRILSVGLDAGTEDRSTAALEERRDSIEVETVTDSVEAVERLEEQSFDCVVSSDTLEDGTSIELLRTVRESFPALPYVLFAETLSDELVSEAVDAGVTDYLPQKEDEARFSLLADRILDVIRQYRATERAAEFERINTVVRDINRALVRASSTDEIDRRVCEIVSQSEPYVFAWIGEHDPESNTVTGRAAAGIEEGYLEEITITTDEEPTAQGPTGRAVRTHELQVMQNVLENPIYEPWREKALERGYQSSAAIPLVYEGTLYGVLNVYADRRDAFDADEQELFEELGDTIAYAHHDVRIRAEARRFQRAIEQAADAIFLTDTDGVIKYVNPAFEELTGFSASEMIGETPRLLKSGEQSEEYYEELWETILDGEIWKEEITNVKQSGERYHAEQTIAPIRDADGIVEGFVAIQRDITERKERQSELERYKQLWTNLPVGVGRLDPNEDHRFLQVNERFVEITDAHSEEALLDHSFAELWREENELGSFLKEVSEGELATTTAQLETLDERLIWGRITAFCTETPEGHVVDFVLQDVTESRESRIHLETAQGVANIGWWQKDISSDKTYWSDQIAEMWGAKDEGGLIDHDTFLSFIHPDDREYVNEKWEAAKEGEPYDISHRIITSDGGVRWMREKAEFTFDDSGDPVRAIGVVQDITERKAREQRRKEKKEEYEAVIENVHDGLVIIQDDVIQFVNSRITELVGYSPDELIGEPMTDFIVEEYHTTVAERHQQRLASDEELKTYEIEIRRRDGDTLPVELSVGLFDYRGRPATITAIRDVSDRTDRTQQLRVLDRVLRHNLRNAMATIQGYAETIRSEVDDMADETEMILKTSRRLMETIQKEREIVDVIAERPEREEVEVVGDVCQPVVADVRDDYPEAAIEFNHPEEASAIAIGKLERAIEELLENAIIHNDQETPDVSLTVEPHGETVRVTIADTGPRIPEEEANVLTREYDVEPLYHGSGLGLWLVNWIVEQSGGTLTFEENDPRGNIITIELQRPTW